jgi:4-hydroxybenzoate polyprenyl transferase
MHHIKIFIELTRLNKPIGFLLLFWPCSWGLAYAYIKNQNTVLFIYYLILFFLGSLLMRSAGCIFNDIVDKDFDKKVKRTRERPIAAGKITINHSLVYVALLCMLAFIILIQFNYMTIILGLSSMFLAFSYPFMKRITYWPQLFLGITFNWGLIMAWTAMGNIISLEIVILYFSAIFWTLGYDTIYGTQDISDDEIIGLKSTALKFKNNIKKFVTMTYIITITSIIYLFKDSFKFDVSTFFIFLFFISLVYQIIKFKKNQPALCLHAFKLNNYSGLFLFLGIFLINN